MNFFLEPDREQFILEESKAFLIENGVNFLSFHEANKIAPTELFDAKKVAGGSLAIPKPERINIPIPFEPLEHEEISVFGVSVDKIVESFLNRNLKKKKYLLLCKKEVFLALEFCNFEYDIISHIQSGHMTTPMIVFDASYKVAMFFENDLAINTISITRDFSEKDLDGKDISYWVEYFNKNFLKGVAYNENHIDLINSYYSPIIPGLKIEK